MRCANCGAEGAPGARFCPQCGTPVPAGLATPTGERRQLTVLFVDLVGSTTLSARLDAEQLHELLTEYRDACAAIVAKYDGHVAQYLGDGILIYFGYPTAHEDDALRAVRTALEIVERVRQIEAYDEAPQVRAAVNTGLVVMGEVGAGESRRKLATGQVPNLAAHMQGRARPGTVVMSPSTKRLVEGHFTLADAGSHVLKGSPDPIHLYQVLGTSAATSRFDAKAAAGLAPFVGRDVEVEIVQEAWASARDGQARTLLFRGEAGIGKSRLLGIARDMARDQAHELFEAQCSPYHANSPFFPIAEMFARRAGITDEYTVDEKLAVLRDLASGRSLPVDEAVAYLAELLSIPMNGDSSSADMPPAQRRQRLLDLLVQLLLEPQGDHPVLTLIEDLHWADPSTQELVRALVERQAGARLLLVCSSRPNGIVFPTTLSHFREVALRALPEDEAGALVSAVAVRALPAEIAEEVVRRTGGVPLFIEAVVDTILESGVLRQTPEGYVAKGPLPAGLIPATIHDSLMSRIDRLGSDKPMAQLAAAVGHEFSFDLLRLVSGRTSEEVTDALAHMVELGLVALTGTSPSRTYTFKHALIRDAAYESLLRKTREGFHRAIADTLRTRMPDTVESQPELLAHHLERSGQLLEATDLWMKAALSAQARAAEVECVEYLRQAISLLEERPEDDPERIEKEMTAQLALGPALMATRGWASQEVEVACSRARDLCQKTGNGEGLLTALWGLWTVRFVRGEMGPALAAAEPVLEMALASGNPILCIAGRHAVGFTRYFMGEFRVATEHGEKAAELFDLEQERALVSLFQLSSSVACGVFHSQSLWFMGHLGEARRRHAETWELVEALDHPTSMAYGLGVCIFLHYARRDRETIADWAERLYTLCEEQGFVLWSAQARMYRGWAQGVGGDAVGGLRELEEGLEEYRRTEAALMEPQFGLMKAELLRAAGRVDDALRSISGALAHVDRLGERVYEPELHRLRGEIEIERGAVDDGKASLLRSIDVAREQGAKMLELRAALALARLDDVEGRSDEAHDLLRTLVEWFEDEAEEPELGEARALLGGLDRGASQEPKSTGG